jgi:hypothetical protein
VKRFDGPAARKAPNGSADPSQPNVPTRSASRDVTANPVKPNQASTRLGVNLSRDILVLYF